MAAPDVVGYVLIALCAGAPLGYLVASWLAWARAIDVELAHGEAMDALRTTIVQLQSELQAQHARAVTMERQSPWDPSSRI